MKRGAQVAMCVWLAAALGCTTTTGDDGNSGRDAYPEGPYGLDEGDVIEPHSFTTADGGALSLEDLFADVDNKLLLLSTGAGWCTACRDEQPALQELADNHGADGLVVLVTLFEDNNTDVPDTAFVQSWIDQYTLTIPVVLDADFEMAVYYDPTLTPMNMIVELDTMEILRISTGFDQSAIEAIIDAKL